MAIIIRHAFGGGVPLHGEVVLSLTRLNQLGPVDHEASQVTAGAGVTLQQMADADPGLDLGIEAVLSDGTVLSHLAGLVKDNTGYDFPSLLAGSERTLAVITAVRLRLVPRLRDTVTALAGVSGLDELHALARLAASCSCPRGRPHRFWARDQSVRLLLIAVPGDHWAAGLYSGRLLRHGEQRTRPAHAEPCG